MSSHTDNLPPYQEKQPLIEVGAPVASPAAGRIAGSVQTCSIRDNQVDYLKIDRVSATSYDICLTVDPTPLYRIQLVSEFSKVGNIQIFSLSDITLPPIAAARLSANPKSKTEPIATICTSSPSEPDALWRPMARKSGTFSIHEYLSDIPIVTVPGLPATPHRFLWMSRHLSEPYYKLEWEGPLPMIPASMSNDSKRGAEYVFATIARKTADGGANLVEIRRGGGLEFELTVILQLFVILHFAQVELI
ncbi:unnamed protein product [Clonostachys rosea]|uniref:Uncharacterized protein n=1 Tax=Bionectria ochroleuca TaxID=29856 RepID=A0ABY6TZK5_BIOOC|nr:unnamed protein product [Clonostachys rosea]